MEQFWVQPESNLNAKVTINCMASCNHTLWLTRRIDTHGHAYAHKYISSEGTNLNHINHWKAVKYDL